MPANITPLPNVRSIAVLRANALGDFIFTLPALRALRQTYPAADIVYIGKAWHATFVPGRVTDINRVEVLPHCAGVGEPDGYPTDHTQLAAFTARMQRRHFDLALQMHGGGKHSNSLVNRLGARLTVGSCTDDAEALDISVPFVFYQNEVLRCLELVALVGATTNDLTPGLTATQSDTTQVRRFTGRQPYAVVHPGATDPRRRWPAQKFAAIAEYLMHKGLAVYVTGTGPEIADVRAVSRATQGPAHNLCDALSLGGLAALLTGARVTVSNDTGVLHLARAVGCPTVGLYWCGNYITAGPMELGKHQSLLSWTISCPVCGTTCVSTAEPRRRGCNHNVSFIQDIPINDVVAAIEKVI